WFAVGWGGALRGRSPPVGRRGVALRPWFFPSGSRSVITLRLRPFIALSRRAGVALRSGPGITGAFAAARPVRFFLGGPLTRAAADTLGPFRVAFSVEAGQTDQHDDTGGDCHSGERVDQRSADGEYGRHHAAAGWGPRGRQDDRGNDQADDQGWLDHRAEEAASVYGNDGGEAADDITGLEQPAELAVDRNVDDRAQRRDAEAGRNGRPPGQAAPGSGDRTLIPPNTVGGARTVGSGIACGGHGVPPYRFTLTVAWKVGSLRSVGTARRGCRCAEYRSRHAVTAYLGLAHRAHFPRRGPVGRTGVGARPSRRTRRHRADRRRGGGR